MQATTGNVIVDKSFLFAVEIVIFCETIEQMRFASKVPQDLKSCGTFAYLITILLNSTYFNFVCVDA
jgi:hypothetical protein